MNETCGVCSSPDGPVCSSCQVVDTDPKRKPMVGVETYKQVMKSIYTEEYINRLVVMSELLKPVPNPGSPTPGVYKQPLRKRIKLWMKCWLWWRPWSFIHRIIPGGCECDEEYY